jgi:hypothetical protein
MDPIKPTNAVDESLKERSVSCERNKFKLSDKEEELYKLLQDKYNQILIRLQELVN